MEERSSELLVGFGLPEGFKRGFFEVTEAVGGVFVEAAWDDQTVPSDDAGVPEFPAMVEEFVFYFPCAIWLLFVSGVLVEGGDEVVAVFVIIDLGGF